MSLFAHEHTVHLKSTNNYNVFTLAQLLQVLLVHFVQFGGRLERLLQFQNPILKHLNVDFILSGFLLSLLDLHLVNQAVLPASWPQVVSFLLTLTHVPFFYFLSVNFYHLILLALDHYPKLKLIRGILRRLEKFLEERISI
jgi:hypothetical protein